jgi:asparagine synthase (glutamine-hydrolysing)
MTTADRYADERGTFYTRIKRKLAGLRIGTLARSVKQQNLTYLSDEKLFRLEQTLKDAQKIDGTFLEFGVALGGSAIVIAQAASQAGQRFVGFDVFGMIPPPTSDKDDRRSRDRYETIASGKAAGINGDVYYGYRDNLYDDVILAFNRNGLAVDGRRVVLVKGLFEETWPKIDVGKVALCHIDCDWYDPVKFCLEQVAPRLTRGGVVLLDDYHDYGGCLRATDEFLKGNADFTLEDGPNVILRRIKAPLS